MIELINEPWEALQRLCRTHAAKRLDILTGYIGTGATKALATLGVRARIVMGLANGVAALSAAQIEELRLLGAQHEVRWRSGLHAKLYLIDQRAMLLGSANFTAAGFEHLDELLLATDDPRVIADAMNAFETRYAEAEVIDPNRLQALPRLGTNDDSPQAGLGLRWQDRRSGFRHVSTTVTASAHETSTRPRDTDLEHDDASTVVDFGRDDFMYMNVAEGDHRCWADCRRYGFLSAGQDPQWSNQLMRLRVGVPIYAYFKKRGYVGLGNVEGTSVDGSLIPSRFDADVDRHVRRGVEERAVSSTAATLTQIAGHRRRVRFDRCRGDLCGGRPQSRHAARPFREVRTRAWPMRRCCPSPVVPSVRRPVCGLSLLRPQPRALHAQLRRRDETSRPRRDPAAVSAKPCGSRSTPRAGASPSRPSARSCTLRSRSNQRRFRGRSDFSARCPRG